MLLMVENVRDAFVWNTFMNCPEARRGMERAGFTSSQPSSAPVTQTMGPSAFARSSTGSSVE